MFGERVILLLRQLQEKGADGILSQSCLALCIHYHYYYCTVQQIRIYLIQGYWTPPEEAAEDIEDTFSLPVLPPLDEKLISGAPPNLRGMRTTMAAWEDESGVVPSDIQASPS